MKTRRRPNPENKNSIGRRESKDDQQCRCDLRKGHGGNHSPRKRGTSASYKNGRKMSAD